MRCAIRRFGALIHSDLRGSAWLAFGSICVLGVVVTLLHMAAEFEPEASVGARRNSVLLMTVIFGVVLAADLFEKGHRTGALEVLRASPVDGEKVLASKAISLVALMTLAWWALKGIDAFAMHAIDPNPHRVWDIQQVLEREEHDPFRVRFGLLMVATSVLFSIVLQHALAASLLGLIGPVCVVAYLFRLPPENVVIDGIVRTFVQSAFDIRYVAGIALLLLPIVMTYRLRGKWSRGTARRSLLGVFALMFTILLPTLGFGAYNRVRDTNEFGAQETRIKDVSVSLYGRHAAFLVQAESGRDGVYILDTTTYELRECDDWIIGWRNFMPYQDALDLYGWGADGQLYVQPVGGPRDPRTIVTYDTSGAFAGHVTRDTMDAQLNGSGFSMEREEDRTVIERAGSVVAILPRATPVYPQPGGDNLYFRDVNGSVLRLHAKSRSLTELPIERSSARPSISPDEKWLVRRNERRGTDLYSLQTFEKWSFDGRFWMWTKRSQPIVLAPRRNGGPVRLAGPDGVSDLRIVSGRSLIGDLDGERWLLQSRDGLGLAIVDSTGSKLYAQ